MYRKLTSHRSTRTAGLLIEASYDPNLEPPYAVRTTIAGYIISEQRYATEVRARERFEEKVAKHYAAIWRSR